MTEKSMVCNGHKEKNKIEKCTIHELLSFDTPKCEPTNAEKPAETMTISSIPFPEFDHLYASSVEDSETNNSNTMNAARTYLNSCHLNIIGEQAKIIESQNQEIIKLRKQNESLIARIERMNRRLNLNQCSRRISIKYSNQSANESTCSKSNDQFSGAVDTKREISRDNYDESDSGHNSQKPNVSENQTANFRIRFRQKESGLFEEHLKYNKMVRFVEAKRSGSSLPTDKLKRNAVDEKLKVENAVLFLKTSIEDKSANEVVRGNHVENSNSDETSVTKRKRLRFPIITAHEPFYMAIREDINCPITYAPNALEVPSYRVIEKDNIDSSDVPNDYYEDVTVEAAKERHLRFEVGERKRKKWDVQRIRELRQNELLKEKLRRRKSPWNKQESPNTINVDRPEQITTLFPYIKSIEKIMITNVVPVTALGTSIAKIPSWGDNFHTLWMNDGTTDTNQYDESEPLHHQQSHHYHREVRNRVVQMNN